MTIPGSRNPICDKCREQEITAEIEDPEMKKFFDIPQEWYEKNDRLRSIKVSYLRYGDITEEQKKFFQDLVQKMKDADDRQS